MPQPLEMPPPLLLLLLTLLLAPAPPPSAAAASSSFSLDFFPTTDTAALSQLALSGGATATAAAVSMPSPTARVQYRAPINLAAFSTYFAFALPAPASALAFFLTPSSAAEPPALAVLFSASHVRVDLAARAAALHARYPPTTAVPNPNRNLHAWIDYNATSATLHVRLSAARVVPGPDHHRLLSAPLDLSPVLRRGPVVAGFRTPSGNCTLFSWAFRASPPPYYDTRTMHSQPLDPAVLLATPPPHRAADSHHHSPPWGAAVSLLLAAACGAVLTFLLLFLWYTVTARRPVAPVDHHHHPSDVAYHKIVLVGVKDDAAAADHHAHPPSAPTS